MFPDRSGTMPYPVTDAQGVRLSSGNLPVQRKQLANAAYTLRRLAGLSAFSHTLAAPRDCQ